MGTLLLATSDGSSRIPLRVISSEGILAHPAIMYDCAGELVGKPQQAFGVDVASVCLLLSSLALHDSSQFDKHRSGGLCQL